MTPTALVAPPAHWIVTFWLAVTPTAEADATVQVMVTGLDAPAAGTSNSAHVILAMEDYQQ